MTWNIIHKSFLWDVLCSVFSIIAHSLIIMNSSAGILQNSFLCCSRETRKIWKDMRVSKWWENFIFWLNYPFKSIIVSVWVSVDWEEQITRPPQDIKISCLPPREGHCHLSLYPWSLYEDLILPVSHLSCEIQFLHIKKLHNCLPHRHTTCLTNTLEQHTNLTLSVCQDTANKNRPSVRIWSSTCTLYANMALRNKQCLFDFSRAFIRSTSSHFLLRDMLSVPINNRSTGLEHSFFIWTRGRGARLTHPQLIECLASIHSAGPGPGLLKSSATRCVHSQHERQ